MNAVRLPKAIFCKASDTFDGGPTVGVSNGDVGDVPDGISDADSAESKSQTEKLDELTERVDGALRTMRGEGGGFAS